MRYVGDADLIDTITAHFAAIESRLAALESKLDPDAALLRRLLPEIYATVLDDRFRIGDLDRIDFDGLNQPQIGKLFLRNAGKAFNGYHLERISVGRPGWRVTMVAA